MTRQDVIYGSLWMAVVFTLATGALLDAGLTHTPWATGLIAVISAAVGLLAYLQPKR